MTDREPEEKILNTEESEEDKAVPVYSETAETEAPDLDDEQIKAAALAYAKYLTEKGLIPGDATFVEAEELGVDLEKKPAEESAEEPEAAEPEPEAESSAEEEAKAPEKKKPKANKENKQRKKKQKAKAKKQASYKETFLRTSGKAPLASITDFHDRAQDKVDGAFETVGKDVIRGIHRISDGYRESRRVIGFALLLTGVLAASILIVFDRFTVYEYAYNGKVLGYVQEQEEVTDVLAIAGRKLSGNNGGGDDDGVDIEFVADQNVTFNLVESRGKSTDDSDTVINKLIYMTDIETEAYAVYDGDKVVAIVKDQKDAETLLKRTMGELSVPDRGMVLVSAEFVNELSTKPVNVLLGSIQSNAVAQEQMIKGGLMQTYHIVEEGETLETLAAVFGVSDIDIYDEGNRNVATEIEQGDKVCIRSQVEPVGVKMVETGRIKEVIEFETIKKETDEFYKGDTHLQQDGVNGEQIFEGTITKVSGVETEREQTKEPEIRKEKKDKIILVGTAERPKTAATGTFIVPLDHFTMTSGFGPRWGTHHDGVDLAAPTGTPYYAADGGTVIRAGWFGGYGNCIDIDHGNGVVTRYGHSSQIFVSVGDLVYQGQNIGLVGSTGWSTGPHLHFEVHINGVRQDPEAYVKFF